MQRLNTPPVRKQLQRNVYVSQDINGCTHGFVRHDSIRKPLQCPYKVIERTAKHFSVNIKGRPDLVSLDRLKPAYLDELQPTTIVEPMQKITITAKGPSQSYSFRSSCALAKEILSLSVIHRFTGGWVGGIL